MPPVELPSSSGDNNGNPTTNITPAPTAFVPPSVRAKIGIIYPPPEVRSKIITIIFIHVIRKFFFNRYR